MRAFTCGCNYDAHSTAVNQEEKAAVKTRLPKGNPAAVYVHLASVRGCVCDLLNQSRFNKITPFFL